MTTISQITDELASLGLDDEPEDSPEESETPTQESEEEVPVASDPIAVEVPPEPPATSPLPLAAAQALARALDQLQIHIEQARTAAHTLCSALDASVVEQEEPSKEPDLGPATDERGSEIATDEGDNDDDASVSQEG